MGRYRYTVEYKKGITNVAADTLSRRPNHQGAKAKFVHFGDQRGLPLVSAHVFQRNDAVATKFECSILPARGCLKCSTRSISITLLDVSAAYSGFKDGDRNFLQWYVSYDSLHLQFAQVVELA